MGEQCISCSAAVSSFAFFQVSNSTILENQCNDHGSAPVKIHGIGKGLMTVWRVTNPAGGDFPSGVDFSERTVFQKSTPVSKKPPVLEKKKRVRRQQPVTVSLLVHISPFSWLFYSTFFFGANMFALIL